MWRNALISACSYAALCAEPSMASGWPEVQADLRMLRVRFRL